jgi:hypothetical protein
MTVWPNQSPEPTRVIVFFYAHKFFGLPSHRSRVAQLFSLGGSVILGEVEREICQSALSDVVCK